MPFKASKSKAISTKDLASLGQSTVDLAKYVEDEFAQVASAMQGDIQTTVDFVVPTRPRQGMLAYADGVHWNPGQGEGLYFYHSDGTWHPMDSKADATAPLFHMELTTAHSVTQNAFTKILFDTTLFDPQAAWDATNHQWKPQKAGYYHFDWEAISSQATTNITSALYKNGTEYSRGAQIVPASAGIAAVGGSTLVPLNGTTDFVDIWFFTAAATPTVGSTPPQTSFSGHWVRAL